MDEAEIRALSRMLDRLDYYRLLRVEPGAPAPEIRAAFHRMRRDFHPDAFCEHDPELRQAVGEISKRVNEAYQVLRAPQRRASYEKALELGHLRLSSEVEEEVRDPEQTPGGSTAQGKRFWADVEKAEKTGDLPAALNAIKMALTFEPKNPHFQEKLESLRAKSRKKSKSSNPFVIR